MRVVHVADYGSRVAGSFIPALCALSRSLRRRGDDMILVARRVESAVWHPQARESGIELRLEDSMSELAAAARAADGEIAHLHFFGTYARVTLALWPKPARIFWHMHSTTPNVTSLRERVKGVVRYRIIGSRAERFIAVSGAIASELRTACAPAGKVAVVRNAIDLDRFRPPSPAERARARDDLCLPQGTRAILFFGRDREIKGADILWHALESVNDVVIIAVDAPPETVEEIERRAPVRSVAHVADPRVLYWAADTLVMPSRGEGFGFVLVEAIACGLPAIGSAIPALREIAQSLPVELVRAEDAGALSAAIARTSARSRLDPPADLEHFGLGAWVEGVLSLYDACTRRGSRPK